LSAAGALHGVCAGNFLTLEMVLVPAPSFDIEEKKKAACFELGSAVPHLKPIL